MLITVRPGPVAHLWDDKGSEIANLKLSRPAALKLARELLDAGMWAELAPVDDGVTPEGMAMVREAASSSLAGRTLRSLCAPVDGDETH